MSDEKIENEPDKTVVEILVARTQRAVYIRPGLPDIRDELRYTYKYRGVEFDKSGKGFYRRKALKIISEVRDLFAETSEGEIVTHIGLLPRVLAKLDELGIPHTETYSGEWPQAQLSPDVIQGLWPEQVTAVSHLLAGAEAQGGGMVEACTGVGKTRIIAALLKAYRGRRVAVLTKSISVIRGLHKNLKEILGADWDVPIGICYGQEKLPATITIGSFGTVEYMDPDETDVLIVDENHTTAGDATATKIGLFTKALCFGLSGTISDRFDGKDRLLEALYGPIVHTVTDAEAEAAGHVCPLHVYFLAVPDGPDIEFCSPITREKRGLWINSVRNALVKDVCDAAPADQQVLIFVRTVEHLECLKKMLPAAEVCHGEISNDARKDIETRFISGAIKRLISTDCLSTGVDPKQLMVVIDASGVEGDSAMPQKRGRLRRWADGKTHGVLVNFADNWSPGLHRRALSRAKNYRERGDQVIMNVKPEEIRFVQPADTAEVVQTESLGAKKSIDSLS